MIQRMIQFSHLASSAYCWFSMDNDGLPRYHHLVSLLVSLTCFSLDDSHDKDGRHDVNATGGRDSSCFAKGHAKPIKDQAFVKVRYDYLTSIGTQ